MPQWMEFDNISLDLYESLHLIIPVSNYINYQDDQTQTYKKAYFEKYNGIPSPDSYYGADVMQILSRISSDLSHGNKFHPDLCSGSYFSQYQVIPIVSTPTGDKLSSPDYYANIFITLMQFKGGKFVPIF